MPKPLPAIMLAVLANVLLLAHSLVPHHHHGERVCFDVGSCNTRERQHHHEGEGCDDSGHPAGQEEGCCVLDHLVIFHPEGFRHELEEAGQPAELDFPLDFQWPLIHYSIRVSVCLPITLQAASPKPDISFFLLVPRSGLARSPCCLNDLKLSFSG